MFFVGIFELADGRGTVAFDRSVMCIGKLYAAAQIEVRNPARADRTSACAYAVADCGCEGECATFTKQLHIR